MHCSNMPAGMVLQGVVACMWGVICGQAAQQSSRPACLLWALLTPFCLQVEALQFLKLRRQLSARQSGGAEPSSRFALDQLCVQLAQQLPQPDKVLESIKQLVAVRDNNAFAAMQTAMAPGASQEVGTGQQQQENRGAGMRPSAIPCTHYLGWQGCCTAYRLHRTERLIHILVACVTGSLVLHQTAHRAPFSLLHDPACCCCSSPSCMFMAAGLCQGQG